MRSAHTVKLAAALACAALLPGGAARADSVTRSAAVGTPGEIGCESKTAQEWKDFIDSYTASLQSDPDNARLLLERSNGYGCTGQLPLAIADLDKSLSMDPTFYRAYYDRGVDYAEMGDFPRALENYNQALAFHPDYPQAYNNRGTTYLALGDVDRAIVDFSDAVRVLPGYADAFVNRGQAYVRKGQQDMALADFPPRHRARAERRERLCRHGRTVVEPGQNIPRRSRRSQRPSKAIRTSPWPISTAAKRAPSAISISKRRWRIATRTSGMRPGHANTLEVRAIVMFRMGRCLDEAIANADASLAQSPGHAYAVFTRGLAKLRKGDVAGMATAISLRPK